MPYKLSDAKTFLQDRNADASSAQAVREYVRITNRAVAKLRMALKIEPDRKRTLLTFAALYQDGTVTITTSGQITGVSTTFTSAMIGRYIYVGGETRGYRINSYSSATSIQSDSYVGALSASAGQAYTICDRAQLLPTDFRQVEKADQGAMQWLLKPVKETESFDVEQMRLKYNYTPQFYGVEYDSYLAGSSAPFTAASSASERRAFLRVYPEPATNTAYVDVWYYGGPAIPSSDTDSLGLPNLPESQCAIEAYLLAELELYRGNIGAYQALSMDAATWANRLAVSLQPLRDDFPGRHPYRAPDEIRYPYKGQFATGVVH